MLKVKSLIPLYPDWKPPVLLVRDREFKILFDNANANPSFHFWITGNEGSGKTLTATFLSSEIDAQAIGNSYLISCSRSPKDTIKNFCEEQKIKPTTSETEAFRTLIKRDKPNKAFIIFDDYQKVIPQAKKFFDNIIFNIYEYLQKQSVQGTFLIISQIPFDRKEEYFKADTLSRLQLKPLIFSNYSEGELFKIIKQRLDYSLYSFDQYEEGAISLLASFMARIGGDARKAIMRTREAVILAENKLTGKEIQQVIKEEKYSFWKERLLEQNVHRSIIVEQLAKLVQTYEFPGINAEDKKYITEEDRPVPVPYLQTKYRERCAELGVDPFSRRMLYYTLDKLDEIGWIEKIKNTPFFGRLLCVKLTEKPENIIDAAEHINWEEEVSK